MEVLDATTVGDIGDRSTDIAHFGIGRKQLASVDGVRAGARHTACGHIGDGALGTCCPHTHRAARRTTRIGVGIAVDGVACRAHGSGCGAAGTQSHIIGVGSYSTRAQCYTFGSRSLCGVTHGQGTGTQRLGSIT